MAFFSATSTPEDKLRTLAGSADEILKELDFSRQKIAKLENEKSILEHTNRIQAQQLAERDDTIQRLSFAYGMRTTALEQVKRALGVTVYAEQRAQQITSVQPQPEATTPVTPDPSLVQRIEKLNGQPAAAAA